MSSHGGSTQKTSQVQARCSSTERGKGTCHPQPRSYFQLIPMGKEKDRFSSKKCPWVFQSHSRVDPMPRSSRLTQNRLHNFFVCVCRLFALFGQFLSFVLIFVLYFSPSPTFSACVWVCVFWEQERTQNGVGRKEGRIWKELGRGNMIKIYCMKWNFCFWKGKSLKMLCISKNPSENK